MAVRVGSSSPLDYLISDPLGSNSVALNSGGQVIALQHYSPYGTADYSWGTMPTPYSYAGERLDSQTGLLYDNFRYYDPLTGQYVRSDNVQDNAQGMDPYAYVGDNPETRNDPSGHCWPLCTMILGAVIGATLSVATTVVSDAVQGKTPSLGEVAQAAVVGAVSGAVAGLVGPEAGPLVKVAVGALASGAGQMAGNAMSGKPLLADVGTAVAVGAITGGLMEGAGSLFKGAASDIGETADSTLSDVAGGCGLSFRADTLIARDRPGSGVTGGTGLMWVDGLSYPACSLYGGIRSGIREVGMLTRIEAAELIVGYTFDLQSNKMLPRTVPNPGGGTTHLFRAWKVRGGLLTRLNLRTFNRSASKEMRLTMK